MLQIPYSRSIEGGPPLYPPADDIEGLPTLDDILSFEPLFTWEDLVEIISSGELVRLKRPAALQERYDRWTDVVRADFGGSSEKYILTKRIRFDLPAPGPFSVDQPEDEQSYFSRAIDPGHLCLAANDWPYSTPRGCVHIIIWSQLPLLRPSKLTAKQEEEGVYGFTGSQKNAGASAFAKDSHEFQMGSFVQDRWPEDEWETAWFLNPPRLQSVKLLPHYHVFARRR